jgi:hypothetical protein
MADAEPERLATVAIVHRAMDPRSDDRADLRMSGAFRCVEEQRNEGGPDGSGYHLL